MVIKREKEGRWCLAPCWPWTVEPDPKTKWFLGWCDPENTCLSRVEEEGRAPKSMSLSDDPDTMQFSGCGVEREGLAPYNVFILPMSVGTGS